MVGNRLSGLGHSLHKFLIAYVPHIVGAGSRMDHFLSYPSVGAAYGDVLV